MKKLLAFIGLAFVFTLYFAGQPTTMGTVAIEQGKYVRFGRGIDSLGTSDTLIYPFVITHTNNIAPYIAMTWTKVGAGTPTVAVTLDQSMDGTTWYACKAGKAQSDYSKSLSLTATASSSISFERDSIYFEARYLRIKYISNSTANTNFKVNGYLKLNIK